ncbi:MAG: radical SAM protein, partial [Firmicutes bacterium]|nr:radical SAM protein [Bacillota bacterium]
TSHPKDLSDDLIDCFRDLKHLCRQIHLPVQSGNTKVLKEMNRVYDREKYLSLVRKLREACPEIAISTDIIVGFPGETEEDFQDTLSLVEEVRYDSAFTFIYSVRQGTPAAERKDQVPEEVKHERFNRLIDAIHRIQEEKAEKYRDAELYVLTEGFSRTDDTMLTGHTESGRVVDFPGDPSLIGKMVKVRITKPQTFSLYGEVIGQEA